MSSPQERQVGRSTAELATNPRSTRPFSASDDGDLLTVLVHFGRQLDALVPKDSSIETDLVGAAGEQLNTYVVASVGAFAASPDAVQCRRGGDVEAAELPATAHSYPEGRVLYEQKCSPYAATRVVEGSDSSSWNEMLAVPLPIGWSKIPPLKQQRPDLENAAEAKVAPADTEASTHPALKLEIVERGVSHQEDFLLATCVLPLAKTRCELQQARFALVFPSGGTEGTPEALCACLYVSLYTTPSQISSSSGALQQVEIVVECFTPVVVTGSEVEGLPLDCTSLAALVHLHTDTGTKFDEPTEKLGEIEHHFTPLHHNQVLPQPSNTIAVNGIGTGVKLVGVSPSSSPATGSVSGVYEWFFPFSFALLTGSSQDTSVAAVDIELFRTSAFPHNRVGRGRLELSSAVAQGVKTDGSPLRQTVIPITLDGDSSYILGHIALRLRWWDAVAWRAFVDGIPSRRVVCTKRWKRSPRPTIAWMGALLRGLNRHPVASICDAGGVSSVLAELIAQPSSSGEDKQNLPHDHDHQQQHQNLAVQLNHKESDDTFVLLRGQLTHLQAEGAAQRQQIARLQGELDTRLAAIKTCGLEIVALRREARQKDEQLQKLKEQAEAAQRREQQQLTELLASTSTNGGALLMRPEHQAASQRFTLLATKYKELDHEYQATKQQLAGAQQSLDSYAELETRHTKLQEAHLVQAALVQRLQRDKQHAVALQKAVRMQEKVIRQFEQTVATQQSTAAPELPSLRQHAPDVDQPDEDSKDSSSIETREALLRVRVQVLEQQLQTNAREAAAEMSALRMRILELETAESRRAGKIEQRRR